ncbi:MAG: hypothetical protein J6Y02_12875 [Pseudobutyrivibrio sp.]|nr:hypothetical protein [Pseudobutyrivibrio sp.]
MSEYIDERIVSIKFDNSGFAEGVSETQKSLDNLNKSLQFEGASEGGKELAKTFKDISTEAKKTDLSPIGDAVENIGEKFNALRTIATGVFLKIGADAVEMGKKLIKAVSIDPISQGFEKYQSILTSQMTLTAALGGKTEEEIETNAERIKEVLDELAWYADETAYSLDDMVKNVSQFANYGVDLEDAKTAMMGIANASAKSGAPLAMASHAMEGFSKAMGQGYMSYQVWRTWLNSSKITTLDFKQTMIDTAKAFAKEAGSIGNAAYENGELIVDMGKTMGKVQVTAENLESTLTKGRWLTKDVMLAALSKYSAAMDDFYEATDHGKTAVSELFENSEAGFDKFSTEAFKYAQQCKTLNDVIEALFDATSTTWYRIFQSLIGDYKQTVSMWSNFAEYLFDWFVYPLQDVASMIKEFAESNSNIMDEQTGKMMTMRDVIVDSFMNIMEAISSVINPIREAFDAVFHPFETMPEKLQNGVEKFHDFTKSLILTKDEAERLRDKFIAFFSVLKNIWEVFKSIGNIIKKYVFPIIQKVAEFAIKVLTTIFKVFIKIISAISSFVSQVFGVRDIVADIKEDILEAAESIDSMTESAEDNEEALDSLYDSYTDYNDLLDDYISKAGDATDAIDNLTEAEKKNAKTSKASKEKDYTIPGGYDGTSYLSYYQAMEKANNKRLAEFIKEKNITEKQYSQVIKMLEARDKGYYISLSEMAESSGLAFDTMSELYKIIDQTTVAYDKTERAISDILNKDAEAKKWETIWDGINEAQKATLITYGDQETALQMYFKQGIKDYKQIANAIGIEEWKIREVIGAYKEAYDVEELLAKKKLEVNADNIDAARQELGYIKRKNQEKEKEIRNTERDRSIAERNARIAERNKRVQTSANATTSKSVKVIGNAIKQIPIIGTAFKVLGKVFGSTSKATKNSSKSVNESIHSVRSYVDEISNNKFITTKDNFYEVKESVDDVTESVKDVADETSKTESALKKSTLNMSKYFKDLSNNTEASSKSIGDSAKKITEITNPKKSKNGTTNSKSGGSLVSQVETLFGDSDEKGLDLNSLKDKFNEFIEWLKDRFIYAFTFVKDKIIEKFNEIKDKIISKLKEIKGKSIKEVFEPLIIKIKEIWSTFSNVFKNVKETMKGFFDAPVQTLAKVIEDIKNGFKSLFSKEDMEAGIGSAIVNLGEESKNTFLASIDDMLNRTWEKIKTFFKNKVDEARNDSDNPFHGLVHMMDNLIDWWDDFTYDLNKYFKRIKAAIDVVFGEGTLFDKLSSGALWRPFLDFLTDTIDKLDWFERTFSKIKDSLKTGFKEAFDSLDTDAKTVLDNVINKIKSIVDYIKNFWENVAKAKEVISGGGGSDPNMEATGGLIGFVAKLSTKWDEFKEKLKEGISWETIAKVDQLELILDRIIRAIANAWIKIGLAKMAMDIGSFFSSIGEGIENLTEPLKKNKDIGKTLIEIAAAIAILATSFFALSQLDADAIERATDAMESIAAVLLPIFTVVSGFTRLMQGSGTFGKAQTIPQALGNGLEQMFGQKNTMKQAAALILGIGAGIYLLAEAFGVLVDSTKDISDTQWKRAIDTLLIIGGITVAALIAIAGLMGMLGKGKGGLAVGGINIENKTIQKTISPIAETLKGFAIALGTLIIGFVAITKTIDKYLTNEDGTMMKGKFAAVTALLAGMIIAVGVLMWETTTQAKKLQGYDPKTLKVFEGIMKPFLVGMATLIYGFQTLTKTIDKIENPDTFKRATILLFSMLAAIGILMFITVALAKWITGEKSDNLISMTKALGVGGDGNVAGMAGLMSMTQKSKTKTSRGDVAEAIKAISAVAISLGFGIKLIASAYSTIVSSIDSISNEDTFKRSLGVLIAVLAAMAIFVAEVGIIGAKVPPGSADTFKSLAFVFVGIGASVKLMADGIGDLSKTFDKVSPDAADKAKSAVNTILIIMGVIFGALAAIAAFVPGGGVAITAASVAFAAIGAGMALMASSVYILAKGLEALAMAMIKIGSAGEEIKKGIQVIIDVLPQVGEIIIGTIKAVIVGIVGGIAESITEIATIIVEGFIQILTIIVDNAPKILEKIRDMMPLIIEVLGMILSGIFEALNTAMPQFREWFMKLIDLVEEAIGDILQFLIDEGVPKLEEIIGMILAFIIDEVIPQLEEALINFVKWLGDLGVEIVNSLTKIWNAIVTFITDTVFPGIEEVWSSLLDLVDQLIDDMLTFLDNGIQDWGDQIIDIIIDLIGVIEKGSSKITGALESLLLTVADNIVSLFGTGGKVIGKLLTIPAKVVSSIITEFKNLLKGGSLFEQVFGDMGEGDSIEAKAGNMWKRIEKIFTDKDHAGINEAEQISESAKKWGIYIANGVAKGLDTTPKDLQSNINSFWKNIEKGYNTAAGLDEKGVAVSSGKAYKLGENTAKGILKGLKDFAKNKETKDAAAALWKEIDKQFRKSAKIKSPSREAYKWGQYIGKGLTNGLEKSTYEVGQAAVDMWTSFSEPMMSEMDSFAAVTSSMLSQLLDANMDFNPVITPVFDMSNLDAASSSMSAFFDAQDALEVAGSFNGMQQSRVEAQNNQNGGDSSASNGPTYNYVQNNYSPKALSAIEIYRRTKNQLNFRTALGG